jgi:hypothetical protein
MNSYCAVFYSGDKVIEVGIRRDTYKEAERDIKRFEEIYSMFHYIPWDHAEVEKIN